MSIWNKIYFNEDKKRLDGFPKRCATEDVVFLSAGDFFEGYFNDDINYEDPSDSEFGFYTSLEGNFHADEVSVWCYKNELITSIWGAVL